MRSYEAVFGGTELLPGYGGGGTVLRRSVTSSYAAGFALALLAVELIVLVMLQRPGCDRWYAASLWRRLMLVVVVVVVMMMIMMMMSEERRIAVVEKQRHRLDWPG